MPVGRVVVHKNLGTALERRAHPPHTRVTWNVFIDEYPKPKLLQFLYANSWDHYTTIWIRRSTPQSAYRSGENTCSIIVAANVEFARAKQRKPPNTRFFNEGLVSVCEVVLPTVDAASPRVHVHIRRHERCEQISPRLSCRVVKPVKVHSSILEHMAILVVDNTRGELIVIVD